MHFCIQLNQPECNMKCIATRPSQAMEANRWKLDYVCFFSKQRTDHPINLSLHATAPSSTRVQTAPFPYTYGVTDEQQSSIYAR